MIICIDMSTNRIVCKHWLHYCACARYVWVEASAASQLRVSDRLRVDFSFDQWLHLPSCVLLEYFNALNDDTTRRYRHKLFFFFAGWRMMSRKQWKRRNGVSTETTVLAFPKPVHTINCPGVPIGVWCLQIWLTGVPRHSEALRQALSWASRCKKCWHCMLEINSATSVTTIACYTS